MIAPLHNLPLVQHANQIGLHDRAESVRNHQHGVPLFELVDGLLHQPFALRVEGAGGLIENQHLWIAQDCARQAQALPLAATEPVAPLAHQGVVALRQVLDETRRLSCLAGGFHLA